jgi:CRP/FNR family transcriptional regulator, cyclic AMP receptor protein
MDRPLLRPVVDSGLGAALAASHLGGIASDRLIQLIADAVQVDVRAGSTLRREGELGPHLELVVSGLVRIYLAGPDGRTLTVRYCRVGALMGAVSLFTPGYIMPGSMQALIDTRLLVFRPGAVAALAATDHDVSRAFLLELGDRVVSFVAEIQDRAFATVRQRIARHLLDLASQHQRGPDLVAPISQQDLADAAGTVREMVVRVLRQLRAEGTVKTGRHGIVILAPDRLLAETGARSSSGTKVADAGPTIEG